MHQRGLSPDDVIGVMNRGSHEPDDDGNWQATAEVRGRDACVVYRKEGDGAFVITVMWVDE